MTALHEDTETVPEPVPFQPELVAEAPPAPSHDAHGLLWRLARRLYGLDVFGPSPLLGLPTIREMSYAALALTIVGIFELSTWSLLFWTVFTSGALEGSPVVLIPAVFAGGLVASIVMVFEITFLTMDPGHTRMVVLGGVARVALIGLSAFVTAQPVEAMLFHQDIQERLYAEALNEEAVAQLERFESQIREISAKTGLDLDQDGDVVVARRKAKEIEERLAPQLAAIDADRLARIEAEASRAQHAASAAAAERRCGDEAQEEAVRARACRIARSQRAVATRDAAKVADLDARIQIATDRLGPDGKALDAARSGIDEARKEAIRRHESSRRETLASLGGIDGTLQRLRRLDPPETVQIGGKDGTPQRIFPKIHASLTRRLAIIDDLTACRQPLWPIGSERPRPTSPSEVALLDRLDRTQTTGQLLTWSELRREGLSVRDTAAALFALPSPTATPLCTFPSLRDIYVRKYWAGILIAMFLPAVSVLCKLLFTRLHPYYEVKQQARLGLPDAIALWDARKH